MKINIKNYFIVPFLFFIIFFYSGCFSGPVTAANSLSEKTVISDVSYLIDIPDDVSISELFKKKHQSRKLISDYIVSGGKFKNIWLAVTISGGDVKPGEIILSSNFNFYKITCYYLDAENNIVEKSAGYGVEDRDRLYRLPSFEIPVNRKSTTVFLKYHIKFPLTPSFTLFTPDELKETREIDALIIGSLFSILVIMTIYNFFIYIFIRKSYYLYYCLYLSATILFNLIYLGVGYKHLGRYSFILTDLWIFFIYMSGVAGILFMLEFLQLKRRSILLYRLSIGGIFLMMAGILLSFVFPFYSAVYYNTLLPVFAIAAPVFGLILILKGFRPAIYFTIAWSVLMLFSVIFNLSLQDIITQNLFTRWSYFFGVAAEITFLSLALGDLMHYNDELHKKEQQAYIVRLETEQRGKSHAYNQLKKVVYEHQVNDIQNGAILEDTMPVGKSNGIVIALDIVNSSTMSHDMASDFFRNYFLICEELINQGYDGRTMVSTAYRIKEMGDGFICSVDFPFKNPFTHTSEKTAFDLALSFVNLFKSIVPGKGLQDKIFCAVGIACGEMEGFYPVAGTKEYDLYGKGIILATRYESLRKKIFMEHAQQNIIILQERVYSNLFEDEKKHFERYNLDKWRIREAPDEDVAYIQYL